MSSFVIDKKEYVKATGIMYGFESAKCDAHKYFVDTIRARFNDVYKWNVSSVAKQYYFVDTIRARFNDVYKWNVRSVAKQYGEKPTYDKNEYDDVFEKYKTIGRKAYRASFDVMPLNELRLCLWSFFRSSLYQIKDDTLSAKASEVFMSCLSKLYESDMRKIEGWWGKIEI